MGILLQFICLNSSLEDLEDNLLHSVHWNDPPSSTILHSACQKGTLVGTLFHVSHWNDIIKDTLFDVSTVVYIWWKGTLLLISRGRVRGHFIAFIGRAP